MAKNALVPTDGQMVQMPYLEENSDGRSAFIQVSSAISTLIPNNELRWISVKIKSININESNSATPFLFKGARTRTWFYRPLIRFQKKRM